MTDRVRVTVSLPDGREVEAGVLEQIRSRVGSVPTATFTYLDSYLRLDGSYNLSPELFFATGAQDTPVHRQLFGGFEDAAPDSWGKELIQEEARLEGRHRGERVSRLSAFESLIWVPDNTRQGALRFWNGQAPVGRDAAPSTADLVDWDMLVNAADSLHTRAPNEEGLLALFRYGTSPGGARPKTNVITSSGKLAIAKLPHRNDRWDVSRWEAVTLVMAERAGISVPKHHLRPFDEDRSILLLERFDRGENGQRIGYLSARSLLEIEDQDAYKGSYTHFAERLRMQAGRSDLHELFRRIAFSLMVTNADDHMRNHGLLRGRTGWRLAPSFDVNPARNPSFDSTPITRDSDPVERDLRELFEVRENFDLNESAAKTILLQVEQATRDWAAAGKDLGEPSESIQFFEPMFEHSNREWVRSLSVTEPGQRLLRATASSAHARRGDQGLGKTAGGGNSGSFAPKARTDSNGDALR